MASSQTALKQIKGEKKQEKFGSDNFKKFFLLQFTKELIKHLETNEIIKLENILKEQAKERKNKIKHIIKKKEKKEQEPQLQIPITTPKEKLLLKPLSRLSPKPRDLTSIMLLGQRPRQKSWIARRGVLRIPESKLPPRLQYLKPTPTNIQIDLEKLNPLIKDPKVNDIECGGPDKNILVRGLMGTKRTNIILSKEEINEIIKKFSEIAKIPIQEGIFKIVAGRLILSAIISDVIGSKFIIKKMMYGPPLKR